MLKIRAIIFTPNANKLNVHDQAYSLSPSLDPFNCHVEIPKYTYKKASQINEIVYKNILFYITFIKIC